MAELLVPTSALGCITPATIHYSYASSFEVGRANPETVKEWAALNGVRQLVPLVEGGVSAVNAVFHTIGSSRELSNIPLLEFDGQQNRYLGQVISSSRRENHPEAVGALSAGVALLGGAFVASEFIGDSSTIGGATFIDTV